MKAVDKVNIVSLRVMNQRQKLAPLAPRIGNTPALAVVRIILRGVKISIHPASRAKFKKSPAMRHAPKRPEEPFDDTAPLKNSVLRPGLGMCHSAPALKSFLANAFGIASDLLQHAPYPDHRSDFHCHLPSH